MLIDSIGFIPMSNDRLVRVGRNMLSGMGNGVPIDARRSAQDAWYQVKVVMHGSADIWVEKLQQDAEYRNCLIEHAEREFCRLR